MKTFADNIQLFILFAFINVAFGASLMYRKVDDEKYEPGKMCLCLQL